MKQTFPESLNRWRLREGPMATEDDALSEGVFIIESAKRAGDVSGHDFGYHDVFQIRSSEVGGVGAETFEQVSVIVKSDNPSQSVMTQRQPNPREIRWIKNLFWEDGETPHIIIGSEQAHLAVDHRILTFYRPADGWDQQPELYREEVYGKIELSHDGDESAGAVETVEGLVRSRQAGAHAKEREQVETGRARVIHDVKRILHSTQGWNYAPGSSHKDESPDIDVRMAKHQWDRLKSILELDCD